jgi:hypothetical protein
MTPLWLGLAFLVVGIFLGMWIRDGQHAATRRFRPTVRPQPYSNGTMTEVLVQSKNATYVVRTLRSTDEEFDQHFAEAMAEARSRASAMTASLRP